jgi:beta-glucosidase
MKANLLIKSLGVLLLICSYTTSQKLSAQQTYEFPFQNPALSVDDRINDLVGRMTVEEKISQMMNNAPAIGGMNAFTVWGERAWPPYFHRQ